MQFVKEHLGLILIGIGLLFASGIQAAGSYVALIGIVIAYQKYKGKL